jgi:hypothetical protein
VCVTNGTRTSKPTLACGESGIARRNDEGSLMSAEMCFMRRIVGYTLSDTKMREGIMRAADFANDRTYRIIQKNI